MDLLQWIDVRGEDATALAELNFIMPDEAGLKVSPQFFL